jgi:hypothetical protein
VTAPIPAATARLLLDAADRLEELAGRSHVSPWHVVEDHGRDFTGGGYSAITITSGPQAVTSRGPRTVAAMSDPGEGDGDDILSSAAWIAALNPKIARPLAEWLREEHEFCFLRAPGDEWIPSKSAVEVARVVLGLEMAPAADTSGASRSRPQAPYAAQDAPGVLQGGSAGSEPGNPPASAGGPGGTCPESPQEPIWGDGSVQASAGVGSTGSAREAATGGVAP